VVKDGLYKIRTGGKDMEREMGWVEEQLLRMAHGAEPMEQLVGRAHICDDCRLNLGYLGGLGKPRCPKCGEALRLVDNDKVPLDYRKEE
jgi:hypothetical protein